MSHIDHLNRMVIEPGDTEVDHRGWRGCCVIAADTGYCPICACWVKPVPSRRIPGWPYDAACTRHTTEELAAWGGS